MRPAPLRDPDATDRETSSSGSRELAPGSAERGCVLIVDDEPMMVRAIQRLLEGDHEVFATTDPVDAVTRLRQGRRFDAILCDLMMPGLSGMDVYDAIRIIDPDQARRMVFMTGGAFTPTVLAFLESVENARIEKPLEREALRDLVRRQVGSRRFRI
jgi:CheY-like chemotaxis protein